MSALTTQVRPRLPTSPRPSSDYRDQPRRPSQDLASYHHALPASPKQNINAGFRNDTKNNSNIASESTALPKAALIAPRPHHLRPNLSTEIAENIADVEYEDDGDYIANSSSIIEPDAHNEPKSTALLPSFHHQLDTDQGPDPVATPSLKEPESNDRNTKTTSIPRSGPGLSTSVNHGGLAVPIGTGIATQLAAKLRAQQAQSQPQSRSQAHSPLGTDNTEKGRMEKPVGSSPTKQPDIALSDPDADMSTISVSVSTRTPGLEGISLVATATAAEPIFVGLPSSPPPVQSTSTSPPSKMLDSFSRTRTPSPPTAATVPNNSKIPHARPQTPPLPSLITLPTVTSLKSALQNIETVYTDPASRLAWVRDVLELVGRTCVREGSSGRKNANEDGSVDRLWKEGDGEGPMIITNPDLQLLVDYTLPVLQDLTSSSPTNNPIDLSPLSAAALYHLATLESTGSFPSFIPHNPRLAFRRFEMAAKAGCKEAWFTLGRDYERFGDDERARGCFERGIAADGSGKEDVRCLYRLGIAHLLGQLGFPPNPAIALPLLHRAADLVTPAVPQPAYIYGLILLGEFLPLHPSTPESPSSSATRSHLPTQLLRSLTAPLLPPTHPTPTSHGMALIHRAAYLRYAPAQYKLGHAYEFAVWPFTLKPRESVGWYLATCACEREGGGDGEAEMALSKWFLCGSGGTVDGADTNGEEEEVPRDERKAFEYAERAARKNLASAEFAMGYYHEVGVGVAVDVDQAMAWYFQAVSHGHEEARERLSALSSTRENALSREQHEELTQGTLVRRRTQTRMKAEREREERAGASPPVGNGNGQHQQEQRQQPLEREVHRSYPVPTPVIVHPNDSGSPTYSQQDPYPHSRSHPRKADTMPLPMFAPPSAPIPVSVPTPGGRVPVQGSYATQYSYPVPSRSPFSQAPPSPPQQRQSPPMNRRTDSPQQQNRHLSPNGSPRVSPTARPSYNPRSPSPGPVLGVAYQGQEQAYGQILGGNAVSPTPYAGNIPHLGPGSYNNTQVAPLRAPTSGAERHIRSQSHAGILRPPPLPSSASVPQFQDSASRPGFGLGPPPSQQYQQQGSSSPSPYRGPAPVHGRQRSVNAIVNAAGVAGIGAGIGSGFLSNQPQEYGQVNSARNGPPVVPPQSQNLSQYQNQSSPRSLPRSVTPSPTSRPHLERNFTSPNPGSGPNPQFTRPDLNPRAHSQIHSNTLPGSITNAPPSFKNTPRPSRAASLSAPFANSASVAPSPSASALEFQLSGVQLDDDQDDEPDSPPAVKHANKYQTFAEMGIRSGKAPEKECVIM